MQNELLLNMQKMLAAAENSDWNRVDQLNHVRNRLLRSPNDGFNHARQLTRNEIEEIRLLDQKILELTKNELNEIEVHLKKATKKNRLHQHYISNT